MRNALLLTQRKSQPGAKPYDGARCHIWNTLGTPYVGARRTYQYDSAHCHRYANPAHFWYYAVGWAVLALLVGFFFFWRAEAKYGRG